MKHVIWLVLLLGSLALRAESNAVNTDPILVLNEARVWGSYEEVLMLSQSLPQTKDYGFEQQLAVSSGLRSAERIFESLKREKWEASAIAAAQSAVTDKRSIIDIALIGVLVSLGETAKYEGTLPSQLQETYKSKEIAADVALERREALK